jgi:hypothetical protein
MRRRPNPLERLGGAMIVAAQRFVDRIMVATLPATERPRASLKGAV